MRTLAFVLTTVVLLVSTSAVALAGAGLVRGNVVMATNTTLVVRTDGGETRVVDMTAVPPAEWHALEPGDPVVVAGKPNAAADADALAAMSGRRDPSGRRVPYQTARGVVWSLSGSVASVRADDGEVLSFDLSSLPVSARPRTNDDVIVAYERGPQSALTALWIEPDTSEPSASVSTAPAASPSPYQRLHGYVQAIGVSSLTLKTDDSQIVALDTTGVSPRAIAATRPGDVVSVVGQITGGAFRAEIVQKE